MKRGFSLIELLIVLAILAVILGISGILLRGENRDASVKSAAEELAAVLRQTRNRAMHEQAAFAVVFHIQNAPDTSGATLNNWSGGHWYRVAGPSTHGNIQNMFYGGANSPSIPLPGARHDYGGGAQINSQFPFFIERLREAWVDEPRILPARKVRFLALADTDEGPRNTQNSTTNPNVGTQIYYGTAAETTYPRPWFGYYDATAQRLHAWGGYDPTKDFSGFYYEGKDGDAVGSRNPVDRLYNNDFDLKGGFANVDRNNDGIIADDSEREVGYPIWKAGDPRPLVNADWMDAAIMFTPTGEAVFLEWNRGRWAYADVQGAASGADSGRNGIRDRAKTAKTPLSSSGGVPIQTNLTAEVAHFDRHTGGYFITLARDASTDNTIFPDAKTALDSILPAYRVFVGRSGVVQVSRVQRRADGYLDGRTVWPPTPDVWIDASTSSSNPLWRRCRTGFLHVDNPQNDWNRLVPTGSPITTVVTERMLTDRIWWLDE